MRHGEGGQRRAKNETNEDEGPERKNEGLSVHEKHPEIELVLCWAIEPE